MCDDLLKLETSPHPHLYRTCGACIRISGTKIPTIHNCSRTVPRPWSMAHSRTARDWSWPTIIVNRREYVLFSTAKGSLGHTFPSGRGATPACVLKRSPVLIASESVIGRSWLKLFGGAVHSDDREHTRHCRKCIPHCARRMQQQHLIPNVFSLRYFAAYRRNGTLRDQKLGETTVCWGAWGRHYLVDGRLSAP